MQYRKMGNTGDMVSSLGFGCMRLPRSGGRIDEQKSERLIASAIEQGVNYLDTAYLYFGNEAAVGNILSGGRRDKVLLATKLPPVQVRAREDMDRLLDVQLARLKTDTIDYYLLHSLMSYDGWTRLKELGVEDFLEKAKQSGKIRRAAFSYHGWKDDFVKIIDEYPWDMAQIQYNYFDENNQAGRDGLRYAAAKGIGIAVMEPLRGGFLVDKLPDAVYSIFGEAPVKRSAAEWGLRWVWNDPDVSVVLSGMNEQSQLDENVRVASEAAPNSLSADELGMFDAVRAVIERTVKVPCTGCGYCLPCPAGVDIPSCFSLYNDKFVHKTLGRESSYLFRMSGFDGSRPGYASKCIECGACEKKCPQSIPIRRELKAVAKEMEKFYFRPVVGLVQRYAKRRSKKRRGHNAS